MTLNAPIDVYIGFNATTIAHDNQFKKLAIIMLTVNSNITQNEDVGVSLALEEMEKNLMQNTLRKHKGKRKVVALE